MCPFQPGAGAQPQHVPHQAVHQEQPHQKGRPAAVIVQDRPPLSPEPPYRLGQQISRCQKQCDHHRRMIPQGLSQLSPGQSHQCPGPPAAGTVDMPVFPDPAAADSGFPQNKTPQEKGPGQHSQCDPGRRVSLAVCHGTSPHPNPSHKSKKPRCARLFGVTSAAGSAPAGERPSPHR